MNYGKNQLALLKFLEKYPNKWHRIKSKKAIIAAKRLSIRGEIGFSWFSVNKWFLVKLEMPQMLIDQN